MDQTEEIIKTITTPQQAVDQFMGEQFIEWLISFIQHGVKTDANLLILKTKTTRAEKLRKFMMQRFLATQAFWGGRENDPGFLGFAIANLSESSDPLTENIQTLLEKRREEELSGNRSATGAINSPYSDLWRRLLTALGLTAEEIAKAEPKECTRNYNAELSDLYSNSEWQIAVGALAAQDLAVAEEDAVVLNLLKVNGAVSDDDLEVITSQTGMNSQAGIFTSKLLEKIVFDKENKELVWRGAKKQLDIRKDFLAGLMKYL